MNDEREPMSRQEVMDGFSAVMNAFELFYQRLDDRITKEIGDLRTEMRAGFAQVDRRLARLDDRVSVLENDMSRVKSDISQLQSDMSRVKSDISQLQSGMSQVKSDISQLQSGMSQVKSDISQLHSGVSQVHNDLSRVKIHLGITD